MFSMYFELGFEHISDIGGYDHILFLTTICAVYLPKDRKNVLILVTAFTIGHSITLALAVSGFVNFSANLIEFLIPVTIFISAFADFFYKPNKFSKTFQKFKYPVVLFFGLIHGLGFSFYLKNLLGNDENIVLHLLAFNLGLEIGQIFIVIFFLLFAYIIVNLLRVPQRDWILIIAGAGAGISLMLMIERFFLL